MRQRTPVYMNIIAILIILFVVYYMFVQSAAFLTSPYFWGTVVVSIVLAFIYNSIGDLIENQKFIKLTEEEKKAYLAEKEIPYFKRLWNSAFKKPTAEEENDILLDHGYDGIQELDNQLPKWWLGLFWSGFIYLVVYIVAYSFTDFAHADHEYDVEYKDKLAMIDEYMKKTPPPTEETAVYSADNIAEGEQIFKTNCVSCHGENGKGGIGPNLTDNTWINHTEKKLFKEVFHMVENGSPNNPAMQAWGKNGVLTGFDIQKVAAFVYHINKEKAPITPAQGGAAPQGDVVNWEE